MATTPTSCKLYGEDAPGWRWSERREFSVGLAYSVLMGFGGSLRNPKWSGICLCQAGQEDIDHVLRFYDRARELWASVLPSEAMVRFFTLQFDEWLHENLNGSGDSVLEKGYRLITEYETVFASHHPSVRPMERGAVFAIPSNAITGLVGRRNAGGRSSVVGLLHHLNAVVDMILAGEAYRGGRRWLGG
ncbi:hypothetical protein V6N12_007443 [Hibiscus sabdariffa]|uniref:Uncharacterized protein n=1 Tax=Hibiscus sabdariffa TaxID=183260 RepID=A0ABR2F1U5_9ROSI